jgi:hypothetical protein
MPHANVSVGVQNAFPSQDPIRKDEVSSQAVEWLRHRMPDDRTSVFAITPWCP